jgi:hemolysin III
MAIYTLIAGTYTPLCLVTLRPAYPVLSWTVFICIWGMTIAGIAFEVKVKRQFRKLTAFTYLAMGWFGLMLLGYLLHCPDFALGGVVWLVLGGVLYSLGVVFYLRRSLPYNHAIWHVFVLAGTIAHFFCILLYVMM